MFLRHRRVPRASISCVTRTTQLSRRTLAQADDGWRAVSRHFSGQTNSTIPRALDAEVLRKLQSGEFPTLSALYSQYSANAHLVLHTTLPYEPTPPPHRRVSFTSDNSGLVLLAHAVDVGSEHKITFCSGFAIKTGHHPSMNTVITCAHTLEEIRRSQLMNLEPRGRSGTLIFHHQKGILATANRALNALSSLPRSDIVIFSTNAPSLQSLPVCPYPAPAGTMIRAHFVSETRPTGDPGWSPWINGTWSKWVRGEVLGYRDFSGRDAKPGTYDSLNHLLFNPPPSAGSSGGPIVDEETGSVIGIILGSRMDNRVEGVVGWGAPSEVVFEMFRLPGLDH